MNNNVKKDYVLYYDLIKIIATFMVCFYHLGSVDVGSVTDTFYIPNLNKIVLNLCAMSVPLFFMVNGAAMLRRSYSLKEIAKRFFKLILLYVFWVVVIGEIGELFFQVDNVKFINVLKGHRNTLTVHLWFLRTLAILTLLAPFFYKLYKSNYKKLLYVIMIIIVVFPFLYNSIVLFAKWFDIDGMKNLSVTGVFTMYSVLYFLLGKFIADKCVREKTKNDRKVKFAAFISIILGWLIITIDVTLWSNINKSVYDGVNSSFPTIGALLMAIGSFYLFSKVQVNQERKIVSIVKSISENIIGIYIFHTLAILIITKIVRVTGSLLNAGIITLLVMAITLLLTIFLKKIPGIRNLLSI